MATIKNYFSSRISIAQIRSHIGANPVQTIQRLNGLTIIELPWSKLPGYSNITPGNVATNTPPFFQGRKYQITMNTDFGNDYTGATYIQDPDVSPVGISVPPPGTIGYFAKDVIPDGWMEIGNDMEYYVFKRQINGDWYNPIYANTEFTAIHSLLKDWGFVKSESRNMSGWSFNTFDPFKGYFIRSFNPESTGIDNGNDIFDALNNSYLSIHQHEGKTLYSSSVGSSTPLPGDLHPIDYGYRTKLIESFVTVGIDLWFNYKWKPGVEWEIENEGTVRLNETSPINPAQGHQAGAKTYMDYANHIHGSIETYYRGYDNKLYGRLTTLIANPFTGYIATGRSQATLLRPNSPNIGSVAGVLDADQNKTFWNPYSPYPGTPKTYYTDASQTMTSSSFARLTYTGTSRQSSTTIPQNTQIWEYTRNESTAIGFGTYSQTYQQTSVDDFTQADTAYQTADTNDRPGGQTFTTKTYTEGFTVRGTPIIYNQETGLGRYYPYHILKSDPNTAQGSEFYNSGDNGTFVEITSEAGNHNHDYTILDSTGPITRHRGGGHENRPINIALRMCIKY